MKAVTPVIPEIVQPEIVIGENQPEYEPLPAIRNSEGDILTRWRLSPEEIEQILNQGYFYLTVKTFNMPLQPLLLTAEVPSSFDLEKVVWADDSVVN